MASANEQPFRRWEEPWRPWCNASEAFAGWLEKATVDGVLKRFAPLDLNELLDYVYFQTGPMADAERGQPLDIGRARNDALPRREVPLTLARSASLGASCA